MEVIMSVGYIKEKKLELQAVIQKAVDAFVKDVKHVPLVDITTTSVQVKGGDYVVKSTVSVTVKI